MLKFVLEQLQSVQDMFNPNKSEIKLDNQNTESLLSKEEFQKFLLEEKALPFCED